MSQHPEVVKWRLLGESAFAWGKMDIYNSVAPSCPKGELLPDHTALGEHPRAGGKGVSQGFLRHP